MVIPTKTITWSPTVSHEMPQKMLLIYKISCSPHGAQIRFLLQVCGTKAKIF